LQKITSLTILDHFRQQKAKFNQYYEQILKPIALFQVFWS